ncbi:MAG: hypothetical protein GXP45_05140 [bacterium]|nr:hypothetical protein [bacterium]
MVNRPRRGPNTPKDSHDKRINFDSAIFDLFVHAQEAFMKLSAREKARYSA